MMRDGEDLGPTIEGDLVFDSMEDPKEPKESFYTEYEDEEEELVGKTPLEQAIPMKKIKNGASNAWEFLSWGAQNLKEQAIKANEKLEQNENFQKIKHSYEESVKPKLNAAGENVKNMIEHSKPKLEEIKSSAAETANAIYEKSQPALTSLQEKSKQTLEACRPTIQKAQESASNGLNKAYEETKNAIDSISK
mmetsp:Transcript_15959/g.18641  ORF Transcript_15959/g.18641 Transcript_15959/m.18641 type:complete len:193 (-) Transcript_15959:661-1239(-)